MYILLLVIVIALGSYLFPQYYMTELVLSFLPYGIVVCMIIAIYALYRYHHGKQKILSTVTAVGALSLVVGFTLQFVSFYQGNVDFAGTGTGLTVLYANIHKDNKYYTGIQDMILQNDPDVVAFVEFNDHHQEVLQDFFAERYPYVNRISRSEKFVGSMIFSRYPIEDLVDDFPQGAWRYGYVQIDYEDKPYYLYVVHTSAPVSYRHWQMRDSQLDILMQDIAEHRLFRISDDVVMVGDFNLSPRVPPYWKLQTALHGSITNITRHFPILFTRFLGNIPILGAHIDHVRVGSGMTVQSLEMISVPGSDHNGFVLQIQ